MSVVTYFVETSQGYLDTAAETQFGSVAATVGYVTRPWNNGRRDLRLSEHDLPIQSDGRANGILARD